MSSSSSLPLSSDSAGSSSASSSPSSSAPSTSPSSAPPSTSSAPPSTSDTTTPSSTPSAPSSPSVSLIPSTDASGVVVTVTSTRPVTPTGPTVSQTGAAASTGNKGFFENKAAVGATFGIVGVVAVGIIFMLVTGALRRRRARAFDREAEEEAKRAPPPVFMDDDEDGYGGAGGYSAYGAAAGGHNADHYGQEQYAASDYPQSSGSYPQAMSGEGTPSNYQYRAGYSDLGFSDVSSHGTYAQQPMEAQYGGGGGGYGGAAAFGGAAAAAGAYEMTGYGHGGHHGGYGLAQQHDWAAVQPQAGYVYPGEEEQRYPPAPSNDSATLARSKSYGTGSPAPSASAAQIPSYADGYAAQYSTPHVVSSAEDEGYGGLHRSEHGHVEYPYDEEDDKPKVLKVANE